MVFAASVLSEAAEPGVKVSPSCVSAVAIAEASGFAVVVEEPVAAVAAAAIDSSGSLLR